MTILEAAAALRKREISATELTAGCLRQIERLNPTLNAMLTVTVETAQSEARQADKELAGGLDRGPLHGIPVVHKDLFCTAGVRTTAGSLVFAEYVPRTDATVVEKLREAGAVMLGKTTLHEHAYGITCNNPYFGAVHNPWDTERIPGGSSGGSAVAVASGMALLATGTDTGGSIRIPASFCGVAGLKPTYGLVSRAGVLPLSYTLDHMGPLARTVRDTALALQAMAGYDRRDPASARHAVGQYLPPQEISLDGVKIGLAPWRAPLQPDVRNAIGGLALDAERLGAMLAQVRLPDLEQLNTIAQIIQLVEAAAVHEPYLRKVRAKYSEGSLLLFDMGHVIPGVDYVQAQRLRRRLRGVFLEALKQVDCILLAATPTTAPRIGEERTVVDGVEEDVRMAATRLARGINAMGLPSLAIPAGYDAQGLPIGAQLVGRPFGEAALLRVGAALEDATRFYAKRPPV